MARTRFFTVVAALAVCSVGLPGSASTGGSSSDLREVVTLEGSVTSVERPFAIFEADGKTYTLHLGPATFWTERGYELQDGDRVTVTGRVDQDDDDDKLHLYLHGMVRAGDTYDFADANGDPLWLDGDRSAPGGGTGACAGMGKGPGNGMGSGRATGCRGCGSCPHHGQGCRGGCRQGRCASSPTEPSAGS